MNLKNRKWATITGVSLVLMTFIAGAVMGVVFNPIFEMEESEFANNIADIKQSFFGGVLGWVVILMLDFIVSWSLYKLYQQKNNRKALLMGIFRGVYSVLLLVGVVKLFAANTHISKDEYAHAFYDIMSFKSIWQLGLIIFGVHLLYLSNLVCEKKLINKILAAMLFMAGIGYILSNTMSLFIENYENIRFNVEVAFMLPMVLGEFGLALWLLIKPKSII